MFLRASKVEAEAAGESTEGMANSVSELHQQLLKLTGGRVDILTDSGQYKSTYEILKDISLVWDDIVANQGTDSAAILELIGGKRNANAVAAILENFDIAEEALLASVGSAGSAMEENAKVVESVQGHINQLKAAFEELSLTLVDSELIKGVVDFGRGLLETITSIVKFIEQADELRVMLIILAAALSFTAVVNLFTAGMKRIISSIKSVIMIIPKAVAAWKSYSAGTATASAVMQASIPVIGLVLAAITALITGLTLYSSSIEETRQKHIDAGQAAKDEADNIAELIAQYKELAKADTTDEVSRTRIQSIQEQITKLVGDQADNLDLVNGKLDEEIKKLDEIALKNAQNNVANLFNAKTSAEEALMATAKGPMGVIETIGHGFHWSNAEEEALIDVLKELGLEKYGIQNNILWGQFQRDTSSIEALLQSYEDMVKLQNHIATNSKDMIGKGGALEDFYNHLTSEIDEMEGAVNDYKSAISNWHANEATLELGQYLKTNDIVSKDEFNNYVNGVRSSTEYSEAYKAVLIELATNTFPQFVEAGDKVTEGTNTTTNAVKDFKSVLTSVQGLDKGLGQLDKIYADIYSKEAFDFSSILNNADFAAAFGNLGDAYDAFIKTVANSPDDINACQDAFNRLASVYINNSDALSGVTEESKDAVIAMLEQMGVADAAAIVTERLRIQTELGTDAKFEEIYAEYEAAEAGSITKQILAELASTKMLINANQIDTSAEVEQLINLAEEANVTTASMVRLLKVQELMTELTAERTRVQNLITNENITDPRGLSAIRWKERLLQSQIDDLLKEPLKYDSINIKYTGGSATKSAIGNAQNDIESLYDSAKNGIEKLVDYRKKMLEQDIANQKDALDAQIDELQDFYDEQREMLEEQYDEEEYLAEQHEKQKAVTDLKGELAMLANDDSAWAQRRKLELKEELSEAEDELSELEKEHALDVTLDMLDDQQEAQEKQLQDQIDALDEKLNDPHALYNQALSDIRNNTLDLYQEMIEFNRRWGSGNDDDIRDMWNDAYESNEDYRDKTGSTYKDIELGDYAGYDASGVGKVSSVSSTLRQGSKGDGVKALQHALNQLGYGNSGTRSLDGSFGSGTRSAVIAFQRANGLTGDGVVGNATKAKFKALGYATGTDNATPGWHELFEGDLDEYIFTSGDGSRYRMFSGLGDKVLNAGATDFLYQFANSGGSILTQMIADLFKRSGLNNISKPVQAIEVNAGNVIVEGNADMKTVSEIRRAQRENLNFVLKSLNSLNK